MHNVLSCVIKLEKMQTSLETKQISDSLGARTLTKYNFEVLGMVIILIDLVVIFLMGYMVSIGETTKKKPV